MDERREHNQEREREERREKEEILFDELSLLSDRQR